jgi:hypothetical protein
MKYSKVIFGKENTETILLENEDGSGMSIPIDLANSDYQRYLRWLENPEAEHFTPSLPE